MVYCWVHVLRIMILVTMDMIYKGCMDMKEKMSIRHVYVTRSLGMNYLLRLPRGKVNIL